MINSVKIKNYKCFEEIEFPQLRRVNLITGKNNTGKSSVLEAISLLVNNNDPRWLHVILNNRGENIRFLGRSRYEEELNVPRYFLETIKSIFFQRKIDLGEKIEIGSKELSLTIDYEDENSLPLDDVEEKIIFKFLVNGIGNSQTFPIESYFKKGYSYSLANNTDYVFTKSYLREVNADIWDSIQLYEEKRIEVINVLKLIDSNIENITFKKRDFSPSPSRYPIVKIKGVDNEVPLMSMGEGINRILTIILAMINCRNGYVFIDEFENGIHYSVQKKMWEIIFKLAQELDIQVFATTHSNDTIATFSRVLDEVGADKGMLCRLFISKNGSIRQTEFDAKELAIAIENNIETR
ncbi:hypothetical protein BN938_1229 [Mucinivorans hirudinis]|uniref:ATPase AAA-type core domain-containing protein n=1 Tax=Mucinivorans hirudinis TaxID=1433126 RepID=A0A060RC21_9BACT|nr:hypothetical protein BN938_1229 [Mucinivorans hirudinis]